VNNMPRFIEKKINDVKVGGANGIILSFIENVAHDGKDEAFDVFALPGSNPLNGLKSIMGRKNATAMARRYLSNPTATFKATPSIEAMADKHVTRIKYSMRSDRSLMGA
tara:strand:- start:1268 stop:1594 length:327 start_codon:yes stop_codon:yes gene_type:complete